MNAVSIRDLRKEYGDFGVRVPELDLPKGYVTGLVGRNGSGKTTLLRAVLGLIPLSAGRVTVLGGDLAADPELRAQVGFVSETPYYLPSLTVSQVRDAVAPFYPRWDEELYRRLREELELPDRRVKELSKGQGKILSFIMAYATRPRLLILDEPTANLDPAVRHALMGCLRRYMEDGEITLLFSTHITEDLEGLCDYLVGLDRGRISFSGEKDAVLERYAIVQGPADLLTPETAGVFLGVERSAVGFTGLTADPAEARALFGEEARLRRPTIEELIIYQGGDLQ